MSSVTKHKSNTSAFEVALLILKIMYFPPKLNHANLYKIEIEFRHQISHQKKYKSLVKETRLQEICAQCVHLLLCLSCVVVEFTNEAIQIV